MNAKHEGCWICKTREEMVLVSIPVPPALAPEAKGLYSIAVCSACAAQHGR